MIAPFRRHLRKWLLGVAVAARNGVQTIVARLESTEENKTAEAGFETAPRGAETAHPGGPPDHWVRLVRRHAPELLQPGPPRAVSRMPSPASEVDDGMTDSFPENHPVLESGRSLQDDGDTPIGGGPTRSYAAHRVPESPQDPAIRRQAHGQVGQEPGSDGFKIARAGATSRGQSRGEVPTENPRQAVGLEQLSSAPEKEGRMVFPRTAGHQRHEEPVPGANPETRSRQAESTGATNRLRSTDGQIKRARKDERRQEDIGALQAPASEPPDRQGEPGDPKLFTHNAGLAIGTRTAFHGNINQKAGEDTQQEAGETSRGMAIPQGAGGRMFTPQFRVSTDIEGPVHDARIISDRQIAYSQAESDKRPGPTELSWPSLPGEKDSEDIRDAHLNSTWPVLPEERGAVAGPASDRLNQDPVEADARTRERIRRLDEEQKGKKWSELHF